MIERIDAATKNRILICLSALVLAAALLCTAVAEVVQPNDDFWYLDQANVLSQETEGEIFFANQRLYDACGAEIVVVAIDSTDGMAIDDYAYSLFNEWEIGGSKYLGFLLLMAIDDEDYYAMPGTMMGTYIDSASISDMLQTYLEPDFAKGDYDAGALAFFEAVYAKTADVLNLELSTEDAKADYDAFVRSESAAASQAEAQIPGDERHMPVRSGVSVGSIVLIIMLLIVLSQVTRRFRRNPRRHMPPSHGYVPPTHVRSNSRVSSMMTGYVLGRMMSSARNRRPGPGGMPPMGGPGMRGGMNRGAGRPFGGGSFGGFSGGGSGVGRSSSSRSFGGFGGASRSSGASRGPSSRGGGAGRFSRK